ncbi:MAG: hypothetical protein VKN60_11340 [Cyanobacteriota bacterium]|nr:hypothetical protein [Cyanobacteriota bacterium]
MKVDRPNAKELTPEEAQELERLKQILETAIADGVISAAEREQIRAAILGNSPGPDLLYEKLLLLRRLVTEKINEGILASESLGLD